MTTPVPSNPAFRKTTAATKLGKALFTKNSASKITPAQITNLLRTAGINVPPSVVITADVAQLIMAGGMIISNIDKAASLRAYGSPTSLAIQASVELLTVCGLVDPKSPMIQILKYGAETSAVISSAGTNVAADISFALDSYQQISKSTRGKLLGALETSSPLGLVGASVDEFIFGGNRLKDLTANLQVTADEQAKLKVLSTFQNAQNAQVTKAGAALLKYQTGQSSVFQYMGTVAEQSPLVFYNYFPELKVFLPPHFIKLSVTDRLQYNQSGGMFNLATKSYDIRGGYSQTFDTSAQYSRDEIIDAIVDYFLSNGQIYNQINSLQQAGFNIVSKDNYYPENRISMGDLAALSLFPPYFEKIDSTLNIAQALKNIGLTPYDMGYQFIEDMKTNYDIFPELKNIVAQTPTITFNGIDYFTSTQSAIKKGLDSKQMLVDQLTAWDQSGDIQNMAANATGQAMLKKWGDSWGAMVTEFQKPESVTPAALWQDQMNAARNIKNFLSISSVGELMKNDVYINSTSKSKNYINERLQYMTGLTQSIDDRFRELQFLSVGRILNRGALGNIAAFFGKTSDKIKITPLNSGSLTYVI